MNAPFPDAFSKYRTVFAMSVQRELTYRASFLMDRARSVTILIAFYAFWSAIFQDRADFAGYTRAQMFTYVLGMNVLNALVFSDKTWEMIYEINTGKISSYLIRPISYIGACVSRDAADKLTQMLSAVIEVALAWWLLRVPLYAPRDPWTYAAFAAAALLAVVLYFLMSYAVSSLAFWTAESGGPRFCFELFLAFASGGFFPLDVLPGLMRRTFESLPFASLLFFPLNVFLERLGPGDLARGFAVQVFWIVCSGFLVRALWRRGLRAYGSEGG